MNEQKMTFTTNQSINNKLQEKKNMSDLVKNIRYN